MLSNILSGTLKNGSKNNKQIRGKAHLYEKYRGKKIKLMIPSFYTYTKKLLGSA